MTITDIRQWCHDLFATKNIRVGCSDWTAFQVEFEKACENGEIKLPEEEYPLEDA
jgi:hypothetical protein